MPRRSSTASAEAESDDRALPGQVSLLRGINVGGHNQIAMPRLREIYAALGLADAATHINSGNVIVRTDRDPDVLAGDVERAIGRELGLEIRVLGRTYEQLGRILDANPFPNADPSRHLIAFLSAAPTEEAIARVKSRAAPGEEVAVIGLELHLLYPGGIAGSKLSPALIERSGVVTTARNLRTVARLHELAAPKKA